MNMNKHKEMDKSSPNEGGKEKARLRRERYPRKIENENTIKMHPTTKHVNGSLPIIKEPKQNTKKTDDGGKKKTPKGMKNR